MNDRPPSDPRRGDGTAIAVTADPRLHAAARRRWALIGMAASAVIVGAALFVLWRIAREVDMWEVKAAFTSASPAQLALAALLVVVSYLMLTGYDVLALRQLNIRMRYRTTAFASFASYAVSFNLGFPLVTGGTVRYWIYAPKGLSASRIASLTVIAGITFWLGMGVVLGWSLLRQGDAVARIALLREDVVMLLGLASLAIVAAYFAWITLKRPVVRIQGWRLELPGWRLSIGQTLLGIGDVCAAAGVLYVLLPAGHGLGYETFLAVYVAAAMLGIASHSPGGLGVFEATILIALNHLPREPVLGALLLFRLIYYVAPLIVALALLGAFEGLAKLRAAANLFRAGDDDGG